MNEKSVREEKVVICCCTDGVSAVEMYMMMNLLNVFFTRPLLLCAGRLLFKT